MPKPFIRNTRAIIKQSISLYDPVTGEYIGTTNRFCSELTVSIEFFLSHEFWSVRRQQILRGVSFLKRDGASLNFTTLNSPSTFRRVITLSKQEVDELIPLKDLIVVVDNQTNVQ